MLKMAGEPVSGDGLVESRRLLAAALLWLLNHYETIDKHDARVVKRIAKVLERLYYPNANDMKSLREKFPVE